MACCAITKDLKDCRNWSCLDSEFCASHKNLSQEVLKDRWLKRYVFHWTRFTVFNRRNEEKILADLNSKRIVLTKQDILKIPSQQRYVDIYLLMVEHGFVKRGTNVPLEFTALWFYMEIMRNFPGEDNVRPLRQLIEKTLILSSGQTLYDFLLWVSYPVLNRTRLTRQMIEYIPMLLDTDAAKELSWFPRETLDKLRVEFEKTPGKEHALTKCLVQRWLPDLKELYQTEKAIQKIKMDQCKEELMMERWHPSRLQKYLDMGYDIDQLDDIM
jgi:hypothetical protein